MRDSGSKAATDSQDANQVCPSQEPPGGFGPREGATSPGVWFSAPGFTLPAPGASGQVVQAKA